MAFAVDGAGGLFTEAGKVIGADGILESCCEDIFPSLLSDISGSIDADHAYLNDGMKAIFDQATRDILAARILLRGRVIARLSDELGVINELSLPSSDLDVVLPRVREKMVADAETVQKNIVTVGAVSAGPTNTGNGTIITSKVLDGYSAPGVHFPADKKYVGLDSEMCAEDETVTVECTVDSQTSSGNGVGEGKETFKVSGNPMNPSNGTPTPYFGSGIEGSGDAGSLSGGNKINLLNNGSFDAWSGDVPPVVAGWTIDAGTNDVNIKQEAANIYRSSGLSIRFLGNGVATLQVSHAASIANLKPLRRYLVSIRYKASAAVVAGTLGAEFSGTGYAPGADKISISTGAIATVWTLATFQLNLPAVIPSDWKLVLKVTGTLSTGTSIYIDDVIWQPMTYYGGVAMAFVPGSIPMTLRDRFMFDLSNDREGVLQSYWMRAFGRQLPSSAAPTISETLAEVTPVDAGDGGVV